MRLFVACDLPPAVLSRVAALPRPNRRGVRWTRRDQWHITLAFLGEVDEAGPVSDRLAGVTASKAAVEQPLAVLGPTTAWFPGTRVLQVPVTGLDALAAAVRRATDPWLEEHRNFSGHLTVARTTGGKRGPAALAGSPIGATFAVDRLVLYESTSTSGRTAYRPLSSHRLSLPGEYDT